MLVKPQSREELARLLLEASRSRSRVDHCDLSALDSLIEHRPEDMTATVEGGMILAALQSRLRAAGQWLPIDPPQEDSITIGDLLARDLSGPRRFGYGTIRDYVIGIRVALANGEIVKAGGKVVKNVAGYDLGKLFIGAKHSLGIIVEATFKLRPLPESELILEARFGSIRELCGAAGAILESAAEPVLLDGHNLNGGFTLVAGFAGATEDVEHQRKAVEHAATWRGGDTAYDAERTHWRKLSVLRSETGRALEQLSGAPFVARLGNGVIYSEREGSRSAGIPNPALARQIKNAYDPGGIFPEYSL